MTIIQHSIGPNFSNEIFTAGLNGLPISWSSTQVEYDETILTSAQVTSLTAVVAAHNPDTKGSNYSDYTSAEAAGYAALAEQGWPPGKLSAVPVMLYLNPSLSTAFQANWTIVLQMLKDAESYQSFDPTKYTLPNAPSVFGL